MQIAWKLVFFYDLLFIELKLGKGILKIEPGDNSIDAFYLGNLLKNVLWSMILERAHKLAEVKN